MKKEKENLQFRILYFIGIILIVANHCKGGGISLLYDWFPAYSYHIALFVFCSGYFFIKNKDIKFSVFLKKLLIKFLVPMYLWNLFYGIIVLVLHQFGFTIGKSISINSLLLLPIYDGHQFGFNLAAWFIPPLLITQLINFASVKLIKEKEKLYILHFIISLLLGFAGIVLAMKGYNKEWWLLLCRTLYFIPFFSFGLLYKTVLEKHDKLSNIVYFSMLFLITLIIIYIFGGAKLYTPSWCDDYDNFYRPIIVAIIGILFWLRVSRILVPAIGESKIVKYISKNTYSIMIHHIMGFFILNTIWYGLSKIFRFIEGFNVHAYKTTIWYTYMPKNLTHFNLIYLVFGIGFSILIAYVSSQIKKHIKKSKINN